MTTGDPFFTYKDLAMYYFNMSIFERQSTDANIDHQDYTIGPLFPAKPSYKVNIV